MAAAINRWRTPEDARVASGLIGPNAILQLLPVLEGHGGTHQRDRILAQAGIAAVPDGSEMVPEEMASRLHRTVRTEAQHLAPSLLFDAGHRTGEYILAHRIPPVARFILRTLPAPLAAHLLAKAIERHAWTFAGSGFFTVSSPYKFKLLNNPVIRGERAPACLCNWHAAVFECLFRRLINRDFRCTETDCEALGPGHCCTFELMRIRNELQSTDRYCKARP